MNILKRIFRTLSFSELIRGLWLTIKYFFKAKTAKEHNRQYIINDVPRKLVKVKGGEVVEKPEWWSGNIK